MSDATPGNGELALYSTEDGGAQPSLNAACGTVWIAQAERADLFQTSKQNVSLHIKNVLEEGELAEAATVKDYLTVQTEGSWEIRRTMKLYNLNLNLSREG